MERVKECYNEVANKYDERYTGLHGEYFKRLEEDFVFDLVDFKNKDVLDLGTGTGRFAFPISKVAKSVVGIDISEEMIRFAKSKIKSENKNISFYVMDGDRTEFEDNSFNVVVSIGTFEHVADLAPFLKEIKRILRPEGVLVFTCHNKDKFIRRKNLANPWYTIVEYDLLTLKRQLEQAFFKFLDYHGTFFCSRLTWLIQSVLVSKLRLEFLNNLISRSVIRINLLLDRFEFTKRKGGVLIVAAQNSKGIK